MGAGVLEEFVANDKDAAILMAGTSRHFFMA